MERYRRLFAALEAIFGKGYVSKLMGKQSNVITLPDKQARKFLDTELNIMEASEGATKKGVQDLNNLVSDTKRLSTLNDQELLTITNNAERLAVKVNPPAPPPAPTADVLSITTKVNKNKDPNVLIDEYNKNQTRLRLTDDEGGTAISYDEFRKLQSRNNEIEKTLESLNVKPALDEVKPEGIVIPFTKKTEDFATGGRVGMAGGGITALKSIIKFLAKNRGFGPTTGSKSLQELNPKQFGWKFNLLSPELKKSMEQNRLEYLENLSDAIKSDKKLLTDIKNMPKEWQEFMYKSANEGANQGRLDVYKKINIDDAISEIEQMKKNLEFKNLPGKEIKRRMNAEGGVSQGLDYLMGIDRTGFQEGGTTENEELSNPTMTSMVMPSMRSIQNFLSNPVVQGVSSFMLGGLPALGNYAKGQVGGYLAGKAISPMVQARLAAESFRDSTDGPFGGYNDFDGTEGTFSTDSSDTGASSGGVDSAGDGGDGYATGGRVGYAGGSILKTIGKKIIKKTKKPNLKRQLTDDEIDDLAADVGDLDAYLDFDGTVGSAEKIRKQHKEYMDYMYYQYKTGRLDPKPGEMNTSRMQYLRNKREQAEMTDDPKLFNPNERDELDNLEETFSPMGTSNKINISDPKTAESFTEFAKQNDPEGFKKIEKIVDDINNKNTLENFDITGRKKNAIFEWWSTREDMNV
jgi:hypothetical protein